MNKLADISVFEGLQATQNEKFGLAPMGVFNDVAVANWTPPTFSVKDGHDPDKFEFILNRLKD